jgi:hypothetical protein
VLDLGSYAVGVAGLCDFAERRVLHLLSVLRYDYSSAVSPSGSFRDFLSSEARRRSTFFTSSAGALLLLRIAVLGGQVAGVAGEHDIGNVFFRALGHLDRLVDLNKMIGNGVSGYFTRGLCLVDNGGEVPPFGVAQKVLEVASQPELDAAFRLLSVGFKCGCKSLHKFGLHASAFSMTFFATVASSLRAAQHPTKCLIRESTSR